MKKLFLLSVVTLLSVFQDVAVAQDVSSVRMPTIELVGTNTVALGPISCYEFKLVKFMFRNPGDAPVEILKVTSTCPCVRGYPEKLVLQPKEEAPITLELNPTVVHGEFKRIVWVDTSDPKQQRIRLAITGVVQPLFTGLPESPVVFRAAAYGVTFTNRFTVTATETNLFLSTAPIACTNESLRVAGSLVPNATEKGAFDVTLIVTPLTIGRRSITVEIPVLGRPNLPPLRLSLQGRIGTELGLSPKLALIMPSTRSLTRRVLLQTAEKNVDASALTWTPQREGVTVEAKPFAANARKTMNSNLALTVVITPKAVEELLKEKEPTLTFAYPNYRPVTLTFVTSVPKAEETAEKEP